MASDAVAEQNVVLVTGASGFIATHVVQQLQEQGYRVRGTVRSLQNATKVEPVRHLCSTAKYSIELVEADLLKEDSWPAAVKDCRYVIHVASPLPAENPRYEDELIKPAVDGTLNVLRACHDARTVKRVILTSSFFAITSGIDKEDRVYTEEDWTKADEAPYAYIKSKALAERAAWDYHAQLPDDCKFELAVINPGYTIGPVLCGTPGTSMVLPKRLLQHEIPLIPRTNYPCVDVRDVAAAHVAAMVIPEAAGHRHITTTENMWFADVAKILDKEFKSQGYSIPMKTAPYAFLWFYARFDKTTKMLLPLIGKVMKFDNSRMRNVLSVTPRDIRETWLDMAYSMIEEGFVKKTSKYTGPKNHKSPHLSNTHSTLLIHV